MNDTADHKDADKPRLELISSIAAFQRAGVYAFGAKKYGDHNWRKGMSWSKLIGSTMRHLLSFMSGEDLDPESHLPHLAHAGVCIDMLIEYMVTHKSLDDRYSVTGRYDGWHNSEETRQMIAPLNPPRVAIKPCSKFKSDISTPHLDMCWCGFLRKDHEK